LSDILNALKNLEWLEPWHPAPAGLETQLNREVSDGHPLSGRKAISVGRRHDCDDVLFFLPDHSFPLAVVHLTWAGRQPIPELPHTILFSSLDDWIERCMRPDHLEIEERTG
jgi:hypothetical protein